MESENIAKKLSGELLVKHVLRQAQQGEPLGDETVKRIPETRVKELLDSLPQELRLIAASWLAEAKKLDLPTAIEIAEEANKVKSIEGESIYSLRLQLGQYVVNLIKEYEANGGIPANLKPIVEEAASNGLGKYFTHFLGRNFSKYMA